MIIKMLKISTVSALLALSVFAEGENIKLDVGITGFYEPVNSFTGEAGIGGNPAMLVFEPKSSASTDISLPLAADNKFLSGEGFLGGIMKNNFNFSFDVDKYLRDKVKEFEDQITSNKDFKEGAADLFEPKSKISAGTMPAVNGLNLISKIAGISVGIGYSKSSIKADAMIKDIGGTISGKYQDNGIKVTLGVDSNIKVKEDYQKASVGIAKELGFFGASIGAGIDYNSFYVDGNGVANIAAKIAVLKNAADLPENYIYEYKGEIRREYKASYIEEINAPVLKGGLVLDWGMLKFSAGYNKFVAPSIYRSYSIPEIQTDLAKIGELKELGYVDDSGKVQIPSIGNIVGQLDDMFGYMLKNGELKVYGSADGSDNESVKVAGMVDMGWLGKIGAEYENYFNKPLYTFTIAENSTDEGKLLKETLKLKNGVYTIDTTYKIFAKLLFLNAGATIIQIDGPDEIKYLPSSATISGDIGVGDYTFTLGVNAGMGLGINTRIKYNF